MELLLAPAAATLLLLIAELVDAFARLRGRPVPQSNPISRVARETLLANSAPDIDAPYDRAA
jgi:hypothetical protein